MLYCIYSYDQVETNKKNNWIKKVLQTKKSAIELAVDRQQSINC